jgi:hypothetical protein
MFKTLLIVLNSFFRQSATILRQHMAIEALQGQTAAQEGLIASYESLLKTKDELLDAYRQTTTSLKSRNRSLNRVVYMAYMGMLPSMATDEARAHCLYVIARAAYHSDQYAESLRLANDALALVHEMSAEFREDLLQLIDDAQEALHAPADLDETTEA